MFSASQKKKRNRDLLLFNHIAFIITMIFGKLGSSSSMWCHSYDTFFTDEWINTIWTRATKNLFGDRYLNFKKKNIISWKFMIALSYDTLIKKMSQRWQKSFAVKWCLYFHVFYKTNLCAFGACLRPKQTRQKSSWMANRQQNGVVNGNDPGAFIKLLTWYMTFLKNRSLYFNS